MAKKPGPKTEPMLGPLKQRAVMLDDLTVTQLKVVGGRERGGVSRGIRKAARIAYDLYQRTDDTKETP